MHPAGAEHHGLVHLPDTLHEQYSI